jgi:hypothetical protein
MIYTDNLSNAIHLSFLLVPQEGHPADLRLHPNVTITLITISCQPPMKLLLLVRLLRTCWVCSSSLKLPEKHPGDLGFCGT